MSQSKRIRYPVIALAATGHQLAPGTALWLRAALLERLSPVCLKIQMKRQKVAFWMGKYGLSYGCARSVRRLPSPARLRPSV